MRSDFPGISAAVLTCFVLAVSNNTFAQASRSSRIVPNSPSQRDMQAREWALTHIPDEINRHFKKESVSLFDQVREDFTRIQMINNEMMQTVFVKKIFDSKAISAVTSEINKRALRLREDLALPKTADQSEEEELKAAVDEEGIKANLLALDRSIMEFVGNSVFKEPKLLNAECASKAALDLHRIIDLSNVLKSSARRTPASGK